jgi:glycolate oxidase
MPDGSGQTLLTQLESFLPHERITTNSYALERLSRDQTHVLEPGIPLAAVFPISSEETSRIVQAASQHRIPIVARGEGSGLAGGANAIDGCLVMCFSRMNRIIEINARDGVAVVEPGVINADLRRKAAEQGLFYAPDPSSFEISSIGGNIATNAGGLRCAKYGVTREAVLGLQVVLADGKTLQIGRRSIKGVAGYDLTALFVGSEGTLGLITQATVRLRPAPNEAGTVLAQFKTLEAAGDAVGQILAAGLVPSVLEIMDQTTLMAVEEWRHMGIEQTVRAALVAQTDSGSSHDLAAIEEVCGDAGAVETHRSTDILESELLIEARRWAFSALERKGATLLEDVAVPRSRLVELIAAIEKIAAEAHVTIGTFGHAADGNLHPTVVWDRGDDAGRRRALGAAQAIMETTLRLGGTLTGEHGVGILKRDALEKELGPDVVRLSRSIKEVFDPDGILNPGKILAVD